MDEQKPPEDLVNAKNVRDDEIAEVSKEADRNDILKAKRKQNFRLVHVSPEAKTDWTIPYPNVTEEGRGILQYEDKLTDIIIRYYSQPKAGSNYLRYFAEIHINKNEKFILDGVSLWPLVDYVTEVAWPIIESRKIMKRMKSNLTVVENPTNAERSETNQSSRPEHVVNINSDDLKGLSNDLLKLPRIGKVTANIIIQHRRKHGKFKIKEDLKKIKKLASVKFDRLFHRIEDSIVLSDVEMEG